MKKSILITLALLTFSLFLFAQAGNKPAVPQPNQPQKMEMQKAQDNDMDAEMVNKLDLTKEQRQKIDQLRDEHRKFLNLKEANLKNLRIDQQNAMQAENYTKVKQINKAINDLQLEIANAKVDHHQAMMKELTPAQKEKLKEMRAEKGKQIRGMMNNKKMKQDMNHQCDGMHENCEGNCPK
ncbi:MAG: Spy/CpxP family protein refolding chaperone [Candidatus Cloacimonadaceae bacterium]